MIARIHNDFPTKFGLPRQSGLAPSLRAKIVFEPAYRVPEALRGLEGFSYIWLIWGFSATSGVPALQRAAEPFQTQRGRLGLKEPAAPPGQPEPEPHWSQRIPR